MADSHDPASTLLRACTAQFLFRSLATAEEDGERAALRAQIMRLLADLTGGNERGFVIIAKDEAGLRRAAIAERVPGVNVPALTERVLAEGAVADSDSGLSAVPLYVHGNLEGVVAVEGSPEVLSAIATLASAAIEGARDIAGLAARNAVLEAEIEERPAGIVGRGPAVARLLEIIARVAPQEATVLILGESGTGKELAARAIHAHSPRHAGPFVAINCAALTESLLESELFGHEKGAFTGAAAQKKGKLELAQGGTAFLDEIGEMAPVMQAKLLRVLQEREFERVGGTRTLPLDVRVVAATNRDLAAEAARGAFRQDLYHRLNVVVLRMPALRDRAEDIVTLARHFLGIAAARCGRRVEGFSPEAERVLEAYTWPGNVRELENAVERAVVLGESPQILPEDLPETVLESGVAAGALPGEFQSAVGDAKRECIRRAWAEAGGDYKIAAGKLGMHPNSLLRVIRRLGLRESLSAP
jgi:transcriptional regulator with GAF, ATPase, and Fis domain